jgi:hypothetical protein
VYDALHYQCMRPQATIACGLTLLVHEELVYSGADAELRALSQPREELRALSSVQRELSLVYRESSLSCTESALSSVQREHAAPRLPHRAASSLAHSSAIRAMRYAGTRVNNALIQP